MLWTGDELKVLCDTAAALIKRGTGVNSRSFLKVQEALLNQRGSSEPPERILF